MVQHADWTFTLDQSHYCETVEPVPLGRERRAQMERGLSKEELSQCRSVIGTLLWYATQTGLVVHSAISLLQGKLPTATGHFLVELNKLVEMAKHAAATPLRIYSYKSICFVCWSDASWGVRPDGSSQGGFLLGACEADFCRGEAGKVTCVSWTSSRLKRLVRSSTAAEVQAANNGAEELEYTALARAQPRRL